MQQRTLDILDKVLYGLIIALFVVTPFSAAGINIFSGLVLAVFLAKLFGGREFRKFDRQIYLPILALLTSGILSVFCAADRVEGLVTFLSPLVKYIVVFLAVSQTVNTPSRRKWLFITLLATGVAVSIYGIYEHFFLSVRRISAGMNSPNIASSFLSIYAMYAVGLMLGMRVWVRRSLIALAIVLKLLAIVLTYSRGALLGVAVAAGVLVVVLLQRTRRKTFVLLAAVLVFVALVGLMPDSLVYRFMQIPDFENNSNRQRLLLWQTAWHMFLDSPLVGQGPGNFRIVYEDFRLPGAGEFKRPHNFYLEILADLGILGFGAWFWLVLIILRTLLRAVRSLSPGVEWAICLGGLLSTVSVAVHGLVDNTFLLSFIGTPLCGLVGISFSVAQQQSLTDFRVDVKGGCVRKDG